MKIDNVILKPALTEKAIGLSQKSVYMFHVNTNANKNQITNALSKLYGVEIGGVKVLKRKGKMRRVGRRMKPQQSSDTKIAFVTVKKGAFSFIPKA